jgi:hypothetical protein
MAGDDKRDDQPEATKTKLDTIVSHLDAMKTLITSLQKEMDAPVVRATMVVMILLLSFHLKFHLIMENMILLRILIGN